MKYEAKLLIPHKELEIINAYLRAKKEGEFQGEDSTIINTVTFPDGNVMDLKCCGCNDESSWTEAVLFTPGKQGGLFQVAYSDPDESYLGEWELEYDENYYFIEVVDGGSIEAPSLALITPEHIISREWEAEGWAINKL